MTEISQLDKARQAYAMGEYGPAEALCRSLLQLDPNCAEALYLLGLIAAQANQAEAAMALIGQALEQDPMQPEWYQTLAQLLLNCGHAQTALGVYDLAQSHCPDHPELNAGRSRLLLALGDTAMADGEQTQALEAYQQALAADPLLHEAVAERYVVRGELVQALHHLALARQGSSRQPELASREIFLQFAMPQTSASARAELMQAWDRRFGAPDTPFPSVQHADPERRLRVGYVSADFCQRSAVLMHALLLAHHDPLQVEVFAYANVSQPDQTTTNLKTLVPHWRDISSLSDEQAAARIISDQIDVLIDLNGHSQGNRLGVFVRRPAPIQLTGLGFLAPTGLSAFTARISDAILSPSPEAECEPVLNISQVLHWKTPAENLPLTPLPLKERGYVSFVSGNNLYKLNDEVLLVWCRILAECRDSRLLLKTPELDDPEVCEALRARFAKAGLEAERLELFGRSSHQDQLSFYAQGDIALDPFPYQGGFSCCEPLWMGVPVIARCGGTRTADSVLSAIGRRGWLADDSGDYIRRAVALARNPERLATERAGLRALVEASVLTDGAGYARELEALYRRLWRERVSA